MVKWCIPHIYDPNRGQRTLAVHMPRAKGGGHMRCKCPNMQNTPSNHDSCNIYIR